MRHPGRWRCCKGLDRISSRRRAGLTDEDVHQGGGEQLLVSSRHALAS